MNQQSQLAERYINETGVSIFLTGKAGTGKTTFLRHIIQTTSKRYVVVAPTGVAAVNAGGVTIHSFFQLPFCPYLPDIPELVTEYQLPEQQKQLRKSKADIIRTLDLLIIDEISMVRADLLDAIDHVLRRYRRNSRPFGGVQLLMVGDAQQLPPVVSDDEKPYMDRVYPSPFFFHSKALQRLSYLTIQLTTVYRQQDERFVQVLNNIRDNRFDEATLKVLNSRVRSSVGGDKDNEPILLTTHNHQADSVNKRRMDELHTPSYTFSALVSGNFPESSAPTDRELLLKVGAQVMFVKNDTSGEHRYFNGKIGTVDAIVDETDSDGAEERVVYVADEDGERIRVTPEKWENIKYEIDDKDNTIKQLVDGTFSQYPLKAAWAITIHKAQGLTFERVAIDAASAFAYGQVYVALSRCRSLEGLTLMSPISSSRVFCNQDILQFNSSINTFESAAEQLESHKAQYYFNVLCELFGFNALHHDVERLLRLFDGPLRNAYPSLGKSLVDIAADVDGQIINVADRFQRQLLQRGSLSQNQDWINERIGKGTSYFLDKLSDLENRLKPLMDIEIDNRETAKDYREASEALASNIRLKSLCLKEVQVNGFTVKGYLKAKVDASLEKPKKSNEKYESSASCKHPEFLNLLKRWRQIKAEEQNLPNAYMVLQQKTMNDIADRLPSSRAELAKIKGLGKVKLQLYGPEILQLVSDFVGEEGSFTFDDHTDEPNLKESKSPKPTKGQLIYRAAELVSQGKEVAEIAQILARANSTIENYLLEALEQGLLDPDLLLPVEDQEVIVEYFLEESPESLSAAFDHFEGKYSYMQLKVARFVSRDL